MATLNQVKKELEKRIKKEKWNYYLDQCKIIKDRIEELKRTQPTWAQIEAIPMADDYIAQLEQQVKADLGYTELVEDTFKPIRLLTPEEMAENARAAGYPSSIPASTSDE